MFKKYQDKETGSKISAIHFTPESINETVKSMADQVERIDVQYCNGKYSLTANLPFGENRIFSAFEGDYIVEGDEIPNTMPQLHNFKRMSPHEFERNFSPFSVIP